MNEKINKTKVAKPIKATPNLMLLVVNLLISALLWIKMIGLEVSMDEILNLLTSIG